MSEQDDDDASDDQSGSDEEEEEQLSASDQDEEEIDDPDDMPLPHDDDDYQINEEPHVDMMPSGSSLQLMQGISGISNYLPASASSVSLRVIPIPHSHSIILNQSSAISGSFLQYQG